MIRWILVALAVVIALVVVVVIIGALLPRDHRASSRITLKQPPEAIWAVISDPGGVPAWWPDLTSSQPQPSLDGHARWQQTTKDGNVMVLEVEQSEPPRLLKTLIVTRPGDSFGGTWTYVLTPSDSGTTVTIAEDGWVANPIFRVMMHAMGTHRTLDSYLTALALRFGEPATPVHVD
ncbi:MAG: SRPBCC domain-containing protein [Gemmatimonadales bacterium]